MSKSAAWDEYWRRAGITTFGDKPTYRGEVRELWTSLAETLDEGAVIADLGAGNGGLEEIFQKFAGLNSKALTVHAFDAAKLMPKVTSAPGATCEIIWHEKTLNEATGLEDETVDVAISCFGFEYGDIGATVKELQRIVKPGGRCRFLMHHSESTLILDSAGEIDVLEEALGESGMFAATLAFLKEYGNIHKASQHRKMVESSAGERFLRNITLAKDRAGEQASTPNSRALMQALTQGIARLVSPPLLFQSKESLLDSLRSARKAYEANLQRLKDMREASVGKKRLDEIRKAFENSGFEVQTDVFFVEGFEEPVGWLLDATR